MNTGQRTIVALLTVIAVLLALNLVIVTSPTAHAEGDLRRCCFPDTGTCEIFDPITCTRIGGVPGNFGEDCTLECGPGVCCIDDDCTVTFDEEDCLFQDGTWQGFAPDFDCSGFRCPGPPPCPADLDYNGEVGIDDFLDLLANWGPCPL